MKTTIILVYLGNKWIDASNDRPIPNNNVVDYVNTNSFIVGNPQCYTHPERFWYNQLPFEAGENF